MPWDPQQYLQYADERGRPFVELTQRIDADSPRRVVDLGCGPGNLTTLLRRRWPTADITGVDNSAAMLEKSKKVDDSITWQLADVRSWAPAEPVDVLVTNAALQWVDGHLALLPKIVESLAEGGWFAMQVPGNFEEPSHRLRDEVAALPEFVEHARAAARPGGHDARTYAAALTELGGDVDAWETTYLHVLHGKDAVFEWVRATGARQVIEALPDNLRPAFETEYKRRLREAYPADSRDRVVLSFRRVFAVAKF